MHALQYRIHAQFYHRVFFLLPESATSGQSSQAPSPAGRFVRGLAWFAVVVYLLICILVLGLKWIVFPQISEYKPRLEQTLSQILERPVSIGMLQASWKGLSPKLNVQNFKLGEVNSEQGGLTVGQAQALVSWRSVLTLSPKFVDIQIQQAQLAITRDKQGSYWLAGQKIEPDGTEGNPALDWLLRQSDLGLSASSLLWTDYLAAGDQAQPQTLQVDVKATVQNRLNSHVIQLAAESPSVLVEPLSLSLAFNTPLWLIDRDKTQHWQGKAHASIKASNLKPLTQQIKAWLKTENYTLSAEGLDTELWADFADGEIRDGLMTFALAKLQLDDPTVAAKSFNMSNVSSTFNLKGFKPQKLDGELSVIGFQTDLPGGEHLGPVDARFSRESGDAHNGALMRLKFANLDAGRVKNIASVLLPHLRQQKVNELFQSFDVAGKLDSMDLSWQMPAHLKSVNLEFKDLSVHTQKGGFTGLNGSLSGNSAEGVWALNGTELQIAMPELFEQGNKSLSQLDGQGYWKNIFTATNEPLVVGIDRLSLSNPDAELSLQGEYRKGQDGLGNINMAGQLNRADVSKVADYLPMVMGPKVREWLKFNLKSGSAKEGGFVLRGRLEDFPYAAPGVDGEFKVFAKVHDGLITYGESWPQIEGIQGDLLFQGTRMLIKADKALTSNVKLEKVKVEIAKLDAWEPLLDIEGTGKGELQNMLDFVRVSPVSSIMGKALDNAKTSGDADLALKLSVPLNKVQSTQVKGQLQLSNNRIRIVKGMPWVSAVQGQIEFSNQGVQLRGVRGLGLGAPVEVTGGSLKNGNLDIRATGTATAAGIAEYLNPLFRPYLTGETPFSVQVLSNSSDSNRDINKESGKESGKDGSKLEVRVKSRLEGLQLGLPKPFAKAKDEPLDFDLTQQIGAFSDLWKVRVGNEQSPLGQVRAVYGSKAQPGVLQSLNFSVGTDLGTETNGILGRMNLEALDVDAWKAAADDLMGRLPQGQRISTGLMADLFNAEESDLARTRLDLKAKQLVVAKKTFSGVSLTARTIENRWQVDLKGQGMDGYFSWVTDAQRPDGALLARFKTLMIPKTVGTEIKEIVDEPVNSIPALDVRVDRFVLGENELGRLRVVAVNQTRDERLQAKLADQPNLWKLEELRVENPESVTVAKGTWQYGKGLKNQKTSIKLQQEVSDGGALLSRFGMAGVFKGGNGSLVGELTWNDAPTNVDYASLSGQLKLISKKGQFLKADPGVAKLLGVLSLQSLPRRLTLDFKDVFSEGFAYDTLEADITFDKGVGTTPNFKMVSPSATVLMEGTMNLEKETQNLNVVVLPDLNPTGGSLVYSVIAANPAVGIVSLIADFLLKDPLAKVFSIEYKVTGPWTSPEITRVSRQGNNNSSGAP